MRVFLSLLLVIILLFSCTYGQEESLVGEWVVTSCDLVGPKNLSPAIVKDAQTRQESIIYTLNDDLSMKMEVTESGERIKGQWNFDDDVQKIELNFNSFGPVTEVYIVKFTSSSKMIWTAKKDDFQILIRLERI